MSTRIGAAAAAELLGVTPATLYAYVSRGKIERQLGPDGRSSLFRRDDVEALAQRSRNAPRKPRPSIEVRIESAITELDDTGPVVRGHSLAEFAAVNSFESIAELLWSGERQEVAVWPSLPKADRALVDDVCGALPGELDPVARLAVVAHAMDRDGDDGAAAARRLLLATPIVLGSTRRTGSLASRLAHGWLARPTADVIESIDLALGLIADHELATSTLAVRVAASVRSSPYAAIGAGLATVQGSLHGGATASARRFLDQCASGGVAETVEVYRRSRTRFPGFGHKIYRGADPRYAVLRESISDRELIDAVVAEVGRVSPHQPNVDLAIAALSLAAGLDASVPLFAVARIAGWGAHYDEELAAPPVRYRGLAG